MNIWHLLTHTESDGLLDPYFLIDLISQLSSAFLDDQKAVYQVFNIFNKQLKPLPVVSKPWPFRVIDAIASTTRDIPLSEHDKEVVIKWAVQLGLMFPIERNRRDAFYYVPSLAWETVGNSAKYHWDEEKETFYCSERATVLYAFLRFPCNHQFFDQLVAVLIMEGYTKKQELFINQECTEAILPFCSKEDDQKVLTVMTVYHPLQNVFEFRTR